MLKQFLFFTFLVCFTATLFAQNEQDSIPVKEKKTKRKKLKKHVIPDVYKDSVILVNGDALVGEIKSMDQSILTLKTPYSKSDFKIKWHKVEEIYSNRLFIISISHGDRMQATINTDPKNKGMIMVDIAEHSQNVEKNEIVFINPGGNSFFSRLKAEFDVGITITKANNLRQFTANASANYTAHKSYMSGSFSLVKSRQDSIANISRLDGDLVFQRFLQNDWFLQASADFLSNSEQLLELRTTTSVGAGYFFVRNNNSYFGAYSGLALNNETYTNNTNPTKQSMELYIGSEFNKYDIGDLSMKTSLKVSPSITESGRVRADFNFDMKYDLPLDFYIKMSATYNYDNQPADGASEGDYVFQTSFGWELK